MNKLKVIIVVQDNGEVAKQFGERLEAICNNEYKVYGDRIFGGCPPNISFMTTASDGRQTATIQFYIENEKAQ